MSGISVNIINLITDTLRDRYHSGFPILKELIQNADDAKATRIVFGHHPGFPDSSHPLLQSSGLFFFNDGGFKETDRRAIASFAENAKAAEEGTIGKFGLGMKSVFHLCEAFFYVANDGGNKYREVINPWNTPESNIHQNWDIVESGTWSDLIRLGEFFSFDANQYFLLWIPLRKKSHLRNTLGQATGSIVDRYPGDEGITGRDLSFLHDKSLASRLASILPLLKHLSKIELKSSLSDGSNFSLQLEADGRLEDPLARASSKGKVVSLNRFDLEFYGIKQEADAQEALFDTFKKHSNWPKTFYRDQAGHLFQTLDKSKPEGSILLSHENNNTGRLTIEWALFLPLEDETHTYETRVDDTDRHYRFCIHGQFFVDGGRRGILGFRALGEPSYYDLASVDEPGLCRCWNQELAKSVLLPMLLPTLDEYVKNYGIKDNEISALTAAIGRAATVSGSGFLRTFNTDICAKYSWARLIGPSGAQWQILNNDTQSRILPIPPPPKSEPNRPWTVFPELSRVDGIFVDAQAPNIVNSTTSWSENELTTILRDVPARVFSSAGALDYLYDFVESTASRHLHAENLQKALIASIRRSLCGISLYSLRQNRQKVSRIISFIDARYRLPLKAVTEGLLELLSKNETDILLVPTDLDSDISGKARPQIKDVLLWLTTIHEQLHSSNLPESHYERYLDTARELIDGLAEADQVVMFRENKDLKVLSATQVCTQKLLAVSYATLESARDDGNLFGFAQGMNREQRAGLTPLLADVLPEEQILLVRAEVFRVLFPNHNMSTAADSTAILQSLGTKCKILGPKGTRRSLIEKANNPENNYFARRGLRYLLHGDSDHFSDDSATLWIPRHQQSPAWEKLWRQITGIRGENNWNVLTQGLSEYLPQARWGQLGIREIEPAEVIEEVKKVGTSSLNSEAFTDLECEEILSFVNDEQLWRDLPLHIEESKRRVVINDFAYLDVERCVLPPPLRAKIWLIRQSENEQLAAKQRRWINWLDEFACLKIALNEPVPGLFWVFIANLLVKISDTEPIRGIARQTDWIPLRNGRYISPAKVIDLPVKENQLQLLTSKARHSYAVVSDLDERLANHPVIKLLRSSYFAIDHDALEKLGMLMAGLPDYYVGQSTECDPVGLNKILSVLSQIDIMPAWKIIAELFTLYDEQLCIDHVLKPIQKPISIDVLVTVLNSLADNAKGQYEGADTAFLYYLRIYAQDDKNGKERLKDIQLRAQAGEWRIAEELCYGVADVSSNYLLDERHAKTLEAIIIDSGLYLEIPSELETEKQIDRIIKVLSEKDNEIQWSTAALSKYFDKWSGFVQEELIGVLLCLLGPPYRDLAADYLRSHSYTWVIEQIPWKTPQSEDNLGQRHWIYNRGPLNVLEALKVGVSFIEEGYASVYNLLGQRIKVPLLKDYETIIAGTANWKHDYCVHLPIRNINLSDVADDRLPSLIKNTVRYVLNKCYYQQEVNLEPLWREIEKSAQLEIGIARSKILYHLPFYLQQLTAHHQSKILSKALRDYDLALQRLVEFKEAPVSQPNKREELDKKLDDVSRHLADLFANDDVAQKAVLQALKRKLKDYQYDQDSIPFELFQNADDAVVELTDPQNTLAPAPTRKFSIYRTADVIRFMHWGRLINARGPRHTEDTDNAYSRDLEKMLVISSSDKPIDDRMTGKFGLGFKSVFLWCSKPCILSGKMHVEIVGGVLPQNWTEHDEASSLLERYTQDRKYRGTLIELKIDQNVSSDDILKRFNQLANLLCVFGHAIRYIDILGDEEFKYSWTPKRLTNYVEVGGCVLPSNGSAKYDKGIAFRLDAGTVFFALTSAGFTEIPISVPSIWVTAPTRETESLGYTVSSQFALDAGRGRLSGDSQQNVVLAKRIGRELGDALAGFKTELDMGWQESRKLLGLEENSTVATLWASLWRALSIALLSRGETGAESICKEISSEALRRISKFGVPNDLAEPYEQIIPFSAIRYEIQKSWAKREVVECLKQYGIECSECVSSLIVRVVRCVGIEQTINKLDFHVLIDMLPKGQCDELKAELLEKIALTVWTELNDQERERALKGFAGLKFKSKKREWAESKHLLSDTTGDREEHYRYQFAPEAFLLKDTYSDTGREFFKRCRPRYEAPTETLTDWLFKANTDQKKMAALKYLVNGELGHKVCRQARYRGLSGTWLESIQAEHQYLHTWDEEDKSELLRLLLENISFEPRPGGKDPTTPINPKDALNAIYDWWQKNSTKQLIVYEKNTYPKGRFPNLDYDILRREPDARKGWLTLFLLGACHTIGRSKPEHHKAFLELCHSKGWMDKFVTVDRDRLDDWMAVVKHYLENEIQNPEYYQWMKEFVSIFLLGYWLDEYVDSFLAIDRMRCSFTLSNITCPRANPAFQGGGPDAPPINRALGMGASFVLRELVRKDYIKNEKAYPYCYVPRKYVRDFLCRLGCRELEYESNHEQRSKIIHQFLLTHLSEEKAIFNKGFDLPIMLIARDSDLQSAILRETILEPSEIDETEEDDG